MALSQRPKRLVFSFEDKREQKSNGGNDLRVSQGRYRAHFSEGQQAGENKALNKVDSMDSKNVQMMSVGSLRVDFPDGLDQIWEEEDGKRIKDEIQCTQDKRDVVPNARFRGKCGDKPCAKDQGKDSGSCRITHTYTFVVQEGAEELDRDGDCSRSKGIAFAVVLKDKCPSNQS